MFLKAFFFKKKNASSVNLENMFHKNKFLKQRKRITKKLYQTVLKFVLKDPRKIDALSYEPSSQREQLILFIFECYFF